MMKKLNFIISTFLFISLIACRTEVKQTPLPDFRELLTQTKEFTGLKTDETTKAVKSVDISVSKGVAANEVIITEGNITFKMQLGEGASNATKLNIPLQTIGTVQYIGLPYYGDTQEKAHGFYEVKDARKNPVDYLYFRISIGNEKWKYFVDKK